MRTVTTFLSTALLTLSIAGSALAQSPAPANEAGCGHHRGANRAQRMIERFDRNQNGRVEVAELPERARARLAPADANRDGVLAPEELRAHFEAQRTARRAQMDADHDGTISPEERQAARQARGAARFARIDTNGDGAVTAAEVGEQRWNRISRADANSDGRVTREELQSARRARGEGHHGRRGQRNGATRA